MNLFRSAAPLLGLTALGLATACPADAQGYAYTTITDTDLGTPGADVTETYKSFAGGITNAGVVVGTVPSGPQVFSGGFYSTPYEGYEYDTHSGSATLVNDPAANNMTEFLAVSGGGTQVLGVAIPGLYKNYFTDSGGSLTALPDPTTLLQGLDPRSDGASYLGINNSGILVGTNELGDDGNTEGFLLNSNGTVTTFLDPNDIFTSTFAAGVNAAGTVVGQYQSLTDRAEGFIRSADGTFTNFTVPGATDTYLDGISDNGNLFGSYDGYDAAGNFVTADNFTLVDGVLDASVDVPGEFETTITGINDAGEICGDYSAADGTHDAFYANPVPEASTTVSSGLLLALGAGSAVVAARSKKSVI